MTGGRVGGFACLRPTSLPGVTGEALRQKLSTEPTPERALSSSSMSLPQTLTATVSTPFTALYTGPQSQRWLA